LLQNIVLYLLYQTKFKIMSQLTNAQLFEMIKQLQEDNKKLETRINDLEKEINQVRGNLIGATWQENH
jgi:cell division protein FtsB